MEFRRSAKDEFIAWSDSRDDIPLWHQSWWLDAVVDGSDWDVAICESFKNIVGYHIYITSKKFGLTTLGQPRLTQYLGPYIPDFSNRDLSSAHKILSGLEAVLPKAHYYSMNWAPEMQNWLPFFWKGYSQTTRYTYQLDLTKDEEVLFKNLDRTTAREIMYASNRHGIRVEKAIDIDEFWNLFEHTFKRKSMTIPFSKEILKQLLVVAGEKGDVFLSRGKNGEPLAAAIIFNTGLRSFYLAGGIGPNVGNSGAMKLCLWTAILDSKASEIPVFDFEGSMNIGVERLFRSFGANQVSFFEVSRFSPRVLQLFAEARRLIRF